MRLNIIESNPTSFYIWNSLVQPLLVFFWLVGVYDSLHIVGMTQLIFSEGNVHLESYPRFQKSKQLISYLRNYGPFVSKSLREYNSKFQCSVGTFFQCDTESLSAYS